MMIPSLSKVEKMLEEYQMVPVFFSIDLDTCTPIRIFCALEEDQQTCFIFESTDREKRRGRYSYIGINPKTEIKIEKKEIEITENGKIHRQKAEALDQFFKEIFRKYSSPSIQNQPKMTGGLIGYFSYDFVRYIESKISHVPPDTLQMPDSHLFVYDQIVAFDHATAQTVIIMSIQRGEDVGEQYKKRLDQAKEIVDKILTYREKPRESGEKKEIEVKSNVTKEHYLTQVEKAKEYVVDGDVFQIVLSQRFEIANPPDPLVVYRRLRMTNSAPYLYYFKNKDYQIVGSSPEMLLNVTNGVVKTKPIAGTVPRGKTQEEDDKMIQQLRNDPKERAEHTMLVDLGRNDVGKVSNFGTVEVSNFMEVERFSKVSHLVSDVKGILRSDKTSIDALFSTLPAGTLSGAPKVRAMELIDEIETTKRCLYGGSIGYLGFDGDIDTCIAIRTILYRNDKAYIQAGGGIVADSVPEKEYEETRSKAEGMIEVLRDVARF